MLNSADAAIRLVVNADDFGAGDAISRGILKAHAEGIVTSTSVLGNCSDPEGVKALLASAPRLGVGAHLTLVGGLPVSPREQIPSLLEPDGRFPSQVRDVFVRWAKGELVAAEVARELEAQVVRLRDLGLALDHLDTHKHIGFIPSVGAALDDIARRHNIPGIRMAMERPTLAWLTETGRGVRAAALGTLAWLARRSARHGMGAVRHGPQTWGYVESGRLDEIRILEILGRLGPGGHELLCHPGLVDDDYQRAGELGALTSPLVRRAMDQRGIAPCRWQDLF